MPTLRLLLAAALVLPLTASAHPHPVPGHPHGRPDPWHRPPLPWQVARPAPRPVVVARPPYAAPRRAPPPARNGWLDRDGSFAVGLRTGGLVGGYRDVDEEAVYGDFGLGATLRWRPVAPLGIEAAVTHYDQAWRPGTQRAHTVGQASVMAFVAPHRLLQPYVLGGLTLTGARLDDDVGVDGRDERVQGSGLLVGPHLGLGLEVGLGRTVALDLDLRGVGYVNVPRDSYPFPLQLQSTAGLVFHF